MADLVDKVGSRYLLVNLVARRAGTLPPKQRSPARLR
jgi:DNA-directed RNA polymerase omega subunit